MRFTISDQNVERIRAFLRKQHPGSSTEQRTYVIDNLGRSTSPGYTMDDALAELLTKAGF